MIMSITTPSAAIGHATSLKNVESRIALRLTPLLRALANGVRILAWHHALKKAEAELYALDDRMLRDIGLDRSEIASVLTDLARERSRGIAMGAPPSG
jgi:uncharacterized protein YjiS (DUF1127 family)